MARICARLLERIDYSETIRQNLRSIVGENRLLGNDSSPADAIGTTNQCLARQVGVSDLCL
ncbi:MAG: hypothetical protein IH991_25270 [Planctomycetes bacterium]|nr:hypothetical protein [Planctomycetota bacterium]